MAALLTSYEREVLRLVAKHWDAGRDTVDIAKAMWGTQDAEPEAARLVEDLLARRRSARRGR
ncbi:hypothetical protein [Methylobacterium indicum]|uniref:hypothetical protein n=1 Tax=Methylobacterium indicum TaxID=1775910 RepID=UPI000653CF00|nr:hypothetical protein [Methylobacterium indicum]